MESRRCATAVLVAALALIVLGGAAVHSLLERHRIRCVEGWPPRGVVEEWCREVYNFTPKCEHAYQWCCERYVEALGLDVACEPPSCSAPPVAWWEPLALVAGVFSVLLGLSAVVVLLERLLV